MKEVEVDLTGRIKAGDREAVEAAYDSFFTPVMNFVYYMLFDYHTACDISQEAFLRTVEACRDKKKNVRNFNSYLFATARNLAMDQAGHVKKFADVPADTLAFEDPNIFADPARATLLGEQRASVARAAAKLNEHQRVALTLRDIEGWSYDDIGGLMGLGRSAVGVLLSRARLKFKKEFRLQEIDAGRLAGECRDLLPLMSAVIDGEADEREKEIVQGHLASCPVCRETMDEMAGASITMRSMVPVVPMLALKSALVAKATTAGFAAGAAAAATVGAGMSAAMKAVIGITASVLIAGAGVGTYVGVKTAAGAPAPTVRVMKPAEGITLTVEARGDGTGVVPIALSVDNEPTAIEVEVDGHRVKRFERGPYSFEWVTDAAGSHTVKPTAFDSEGKAHPGRSVSFTLAIKKKIAEKIAFLRGGNIFTIGADGSGEAQVTSTGAAQDFATSPTTGQIAFIDGSRVMFLVNHDGGGLRQVTLPERGKVECAAFSRDGSSIYFARGVKLQGDTDYSCHMRFERYDVAANRVDTVYTDPEPYQDESVGAIFTDASGDYLYYNHFGSDFPSCEVHRISLGATGADEGYLMPRTDVPGATVVKYRMTSISADGSHVSYQNQAVLTASPAPGSTLGVAIEVSNRFRPTGGGGEKVLSTVELSTLSLSSPRIEEVEFSQVDAGRYFYAEKSQTSNTAAVFKRVFYTGTLDGQPTATGLTSSGWDEWHMICVPGT